MARRRRKQLGSPVSEHKRREGQALAAAREETRLVKRALDKGHCSAAFASLTGAAAAWGQYNAEHQGAGGSGGDSRGPGVRATESAYFEQKSRFRSMCLK